MDRFSVLCVDDEVENVAMMMRILSDRYTVYGATSGAQGLEIVKSHKIHAIISDQRMPGMTGLQLLHEVRQTDDKIVLVILTAYADLSMAIDAINNERIQGYFQKPIPASELLNFLKREFERVHLEEENHRLLKETQTLNEDLQRLNRLKSDFLRILSHEIRTPLTTITACLDLLKPGELSADPGDYSTLWSLAQSSSDSLRGLLDDVLYLLELENLGFKVNPEPIAVKRLVKMMIERFRVRFEGKALQLEEDFQNDPKIMGDPDALTRVFRNLLGNAIEFSQQGGLIQVGFCPAGKNLKIWITNTGNDAHPEFHEKVFQLPDQSDRRNGRSIVGTGVNLAIAKILIEAHGGTIGLERKPDHNDTVLLELPLSLNGRSEKSGSALPH